MLVVAACSSGGEGDEKSVLISAVQPNPNPNLEVDPMMLRSLCLSLPHQRRGNRQNG